MSCCGELRTVEQQYLDILRMLLENGNGKDDRTGVGTFSLFGVQLRHRFADGFPLLTTKRVHWKSIVYELLWFLRGEMNVRWLQRQGVTIWDEWADEAGELGPIYGYQWRSWPTPDNRHIDQIAEVIEQITTSPDSRRHIVSAWNVGQIDSMALPPCHCFFQFYVYNRQLSCQMYQRSADWFLGVPFNLASYALLTMMIAQVCGLTPHELVITFGDYHLYRNHLEQAQTQLSRSPRPLPTMILNPIRNIDDFRFDDFELRGYSPYPSIKAPIAV